MDETLCFMVLVPNIPVRTCRHTQTSKAAGLCGAPVCPNHTETDRGSLSFTRRLKQQERGTWSEAHSERGRGGKREKCTPLFSAIVIFPIFIHLLLVLVINVCSLNDAFLVSSDKRERQTGTAFRQRRIVNR